MGMDSNMITGRTRCFVVMLFSLTNLPLSVRSHPVQPARHVGAWWLQNPSSNIRIPDCGRTQLDTVKTIHAGDGWNIVLIETLEMATTQLSHDRRIEEGKG